MVSRGIERDNKNALTLPMGGGIVSLCLKETPINPDVSPARKEPQACGGGCANCSQMDRAPGIGEWSGWPLAAGAAGVFVLPLVLALVGSLLAGESWRWAGALVGLLIGIFGAAGTVAALRRSTRRCDDHSNQ